MYRAPVFPIQRPRPLGEIIKMNLILLKLYIKLHELAHREDGQDLVEYALLVALIAFGATAGMKSLSNGLNTAFNGISSKLGTYTN